MQHVRKTLFQRFLWVFVLLLIPFSLHHGQITQAQTDQEYLSEPYAIIEPEDGDIWKAGGRVTIRWRQTDFSVEDHDAKFKLIPDDSDKPERVIRQVSTDSDRDTQETTFTLPEYISPGSYQIIMIDAKEDPEYGEILDGWMEGRIQVVSAINIFRVIDPKHGDAATAGKRQTIRWNTEGSSTHVSISLYQSFLETKSGAVERVATIASNVSNDSEFTWTIPSTILRNRSSEGYVYHVFDPVNTFAERGIGLPEYPTARSTTARLGQSSGASDWSGYFTIKEADSSVNDNDSQGTKPAPKPTPQPPRTTTQFSLISALNDNRVYAIKQLKRLWIPSPVAFEKGGYQWRNIVLVTPGELSAYQQIKLAKTTSSDRIYYLTNGGQKRLMLNDAVFRSYGNRSSDVVTLTDRELAMFPDVQFIHLNGSPNIYKIQGSKKYWVRTPAVFTRIAPPSAQVAPVNATEFQAYETGGVIE